MTFYFRKMFEAAAPGGRISDLRRRLNTRSTPMVIILLEIWLASTTYLVMALMPKDEPAPRNVWFYDLKANKLFIALETTLPPIEAPSGSMDNGAPAGVRAYVFGCGTCKPVDRFIGYLEITTPIAKDTLMAARSEGHDQLLRYLDDMQRQGKVPLLVRDPVVDRWMPTNSREGQEILAVQDKCDDPASLRQCLPN